MTLTPQHLKGAGKRLFGPKWKAPLARALGYSYAQLWRLLSGKAAITITLEQAMTGIEARKGGFVPSWEKPRRSTGAPETPE